MAAPNTAPDDFAVPYDAPRQQRMVAMAQPNAPKKDYMKFWLISLAVEEAGLQPSGSKTIGDNARRILDWESS